MATGQRWPPRDRSPSRAYSNNAGSYNNNNNGISSSSSSSSTIHPSRSANFPSRPDHSNPGPDAPRGPRALNERGSNYAPPPAPRGRAGFQSRESYHADYRDREPLRPSRDLSPPPRLQVADRDRSWRDRERDFLDKPSPLPRAELRDFRDAPSRDFEAPRARRPSRESGYPDGTPYQDSRSSHPHFAGRDEFYRGRGRYESYRGRGRGGHHDDRNSYRPRSRSPRGRYQYPSDDAESHRKDQFAPRHLNQSPGPSSPRPRSPLSYSISSTRGPSHADRDEIAGRRVYSSSTLPEGRESRREPAKADPASKANDSSRPSSPPRAPEVPAFGSLPPFKPQPTNQWNVWTAPTPARTSSQQTDLGPPPNTESVKQPANPPKIDTAPPKAPKAERIPPPSKAPDAPSLASRGPITADVTPTPGRHDNLSNEIPLRAPESPELMKMPPTGPKNMAGPPLGPKIDSSSTRSSKSFAIGQARGISPPISPPTSAPSAPRAIAAQISPNPQLAAAPTAPKADRLLQVQVPRGPAMPRQRSRPELGPHYGRPPGIIPSKRDLSGAEKRYSEAEESSFDSQYRNSHRAQAELGIRPKSAAAPGQNNHRPDEEEVSLNDHVLNISAPLNARAKMESYSEEEEGMDLDEEDIRQNEGRHEKDKRELEQGKTDLSTRYYRGSTPLETLAMLQRLMLEDPFKFFPRKVAHADATHAGQDQEAQENEDAAETDDVLAGGTEGTVRPMTRDPIDIDRVSPSPVQSPELRSLPFLAQEPLTPNSELEILSENKKRYEAARELISLELQRQAWKEQEEDDILKHDYAELYKPWRLQCRDFDQQKEKEEREDREAIEAANAQTEGQVSPVTNSTSENRRKRLWNTEADEMRAIELSVQTANEAQAKREREAADAQPDFDREAKIPDLLSAIELESRKFTDTSGLIDSNEAIAVFQLQPTEDDLDEQEHIVFVKNYKDWPKKFGKMSQGLGGRSYKELINHYYSTKWNGQYKGLGEKRRGKGVKGPRMRLDVSGRPKANALLSNLPDSKPDLYDGEEANAPMAAVTDRGRPKRTAAPVFSREKEGDEQSVATANAPARRTKQDGSGDQGHEKSTRKPRTAGKEKSRRTKSQQTVRQTKSVSPEKQEEANRGLGADEGLDADLRNKELDGTSTSAQVQARPQPNQFSVLDTSPQKAPGGAVQSPTPSDPNKPPVLAPSKPGTSSYWSVPEVSAFPKLLEHFGADWVAIANHMQTKTVTMVKNYYNRNKGERPEMERLAADGDKKRQRPEMPVSTSSSTPGKRRNEPAQHPPPRFLAPSTAPGEIVDLVEEDSPSSKGVRPGIQQRPRTSSLQKQIFQAGDKPMAPAFTTQPTSHPAIGQIYSGPSTFIHNTQSPAHARTAPPRDPQITMLPQMDQGQFVAKTSQPAMSPESQRTMQAIPQQVMQQPISKSWEPQRRPAMSPPSLQRESALPTFIEYSRQGPAPSEAHKPGMLPTFGRLPESRVAEERYTTLPARQSSPGAQRPQGIRHILDHPNQRPAYFEQPRFTQRSPQSKESLRPPGLQPESPSQPVPAPKSEPRKSNLSAILNSEPIQKKSPPRAFTSPSVPLTSVDHRPTATYRPGHSPHPPTSQTEPKDAPREFSRIHGPTGEGYPPPISHYPSRPSSVSGRHRETPLHSGAFKIDWHGPPQNWRPEQAQDRGVDSPTTAMLSGHRGPLQSMHLRHNPSPPPSLQYSHSQAHSRDSSFSRPPAAQTHAPPHNAHKSQQPSMSHMQAQHMPSPQAQHHHQYPPSRQPHPNQQPHIHQQHHHHQPPQPQQTTQPGYYANPPSSQPPDFFNSQTHAQNVSAPRVMSPLASAGPSPYHRHQLSEGGGPGRTTPLRYDHPPPHAPPISQAERLGPSSERERERQQEQPRYGPAQHIPPPTFGPYTAPRDR